MYDFNIIVQKMLKRFYSAKLDYKYYNVTVR
jgi:hypothetical protein